MGGGKQILSHRTAGGAVVLGALLALGLIATSVGYHPVSIDGSGRDLLLTDLGLLLAYGAAGIFFWYQRNGKIGVALQVGTLAGVALGTVQIANHVIETFVANRYFAVIITPILLMLAIFAAAGSIAWERTRSFAPAVLAGIWCGMVAMLILLCFALPFNLVFELRVESQLQGAFAVSGMNDRGAFAVRNSLLAASEGLGRMPVFGLIVSFVGAVASTFTDRCSRAVLIVAGSVVPLLLVAGVVFLVRANGLERAARPPFVMAGVLLACVGLSFVFPIWWALRRTAPR